MLKSQIQAFMACVGLFMLGYGSAKWNSFMGERVRERQRRQEPVRCWNWKVGE